MPSLSPNPPTAPSPNASTTAAQVRPAPTKRYSSTSAHALARQNVVSPSSAGDQHALKHTVRPNRHAKLVLPRNHSSGRNLAKLARQAQKEQYQGGDDGHRHSRQRSHEGDTEIRLPGSLDESESRPPPMRRNMTAYQLPRATSHVKLKKNLSHGHLSRLQSGRNLQALSSGSSRAPLSPGLKGKKRPKSAEMAALLAEPILHEREEELLRAQQAGAARRKVGFAVGSAGDTAGEDEDVPDMEGSGLQEDEWTEESASASPFSTRQNTANNSRRASITERHIELKPSHLGTKQSGLQRPTEPEPEPEPEPEEDEDETPSASEETVTDDESPQQTPMSRKEGSGEMGKQLQPVPNQAKAPQRSPLHAAKDYPNPAARRTLSHHASLPAPALVSNVSTLDDGASPSASLVSSRSNLEGSAEQEDELVSRFIPSGSHPSTGSGGNTTMSTPKQSGWHTPTEESGIQRVKGGNLHLGTASPGSTISATSSANTPAHGRSRIELKMLGEKALADREAAAERAPMYPHHIYDRRNETLKSYLNLASLGGDGRGGIGPHSGLSMGPEIFQGRFKAVNTELKVVQRFRDPVRESVSRLKQCKGTRLDTKRTSTQKQAAALKTSKSAVALATQRGQTTAAAAASPPLSQRPEMAKSDSPAQNSVLPSVQSAVNIGQSADAIIKAPSDARRSGVRRGVSFAGTHHDKIDPPRQPESGPDGAARMLWEDLA